MNKFVRKEWDSVKENLSRKNSFTRNFAYLFSAKSIILIFGLLITPLLTRYYDPETYGIFSIFNLVAVNVSIAVTGAYDSALVITRHRARFNSLFVLIFYSSFIFLGLGIMAVFTVNFLFDESLWSGLGLSLGTGELYLLAFYTFLVSISLGFPAYNVRAGNFKLSSIINIVRQGLTKVSALLIAIFLNAPLLGLVYSEIIGRVTMISLVSLKYRNEIYIALKQASLRGIKDSIGEEINYPKYVLPSRIIQNFSGQILILFFSVYHGSNILGQYSLAVSIVSIPVLLIGNAIVPILTRKCATAIDSKIVLAYFKRILVLSSICYTPLIIILAFFGEDLFIIVFGDDWKVAGQIAWVISLLSFSTFIYMTANPLYQKYRKQKIILGLNFATILFGGVILYLTEVIYQDYVVSLISYTILSLSLAFINILLLNSIGSRGKNANF